VLPAMPTASAVPPQAIARAASLSLQLLVLVGDRDTGVPGAVRLEVPRQLPRFLALPDRTGWVPVEQALAAHLGRLLPGMPILGHHTFRVTRDARQSPVPAGAGNLVTAVEAMVQRRRRFARVVRLEVDASMPRAVLRTLVRELEVAERDVYRVRGLLDLGGLLDLHDLAGAERRGPPPAPARASRRRRIASRPSPDVLGATERGDILLHHPYETHAISVEAFLEQAARDPDVLAIKQTLCRSSERAGPVVGSLVRAAEAGKEVVALIELTTRLHESASIAVARLLTQAGAHVVHGATGLTTHATLTLVVRRAAGGVRRYCHIGTGSSTQDTPLLREDLSLLSADAALGADVADLFNHLTGGGRPPRFRRLLVAPSTLRRDLLELIGRQSVPGGRIVVKVNHLGDRGIIEALYAASAAGARVDLIVRGICGLRPGVRGLSDRIRVRSLVGRWPEHSRILGFGAGAGARWYIGSADLLSRNLGSRVEVLAPVADPCLRARLAEIVEVLLADDTVAWRLGADGRWRRVETRRGVCAQERLLRLAATPPRSSGTTAGGA
jgi:polyphosphate kinase